jgi:hypothetical protein
MTADTPLAVATERATAPLLFGKRRALSPGAVLQYVGTDTERDLKG